MLLNEAITQFDAANNEDPNKETVAGKEYSKELLYSQRMTAWLHRLESSPPEALQLAVRCQHIQRWKIPRQDYPAGREGYLKWRRDLAQFHAEKAGQILRSIGYDLNTIERVQALVQKKHLKQDPAVQALEDVACLVFLEFYFETFASLHPEDKVIEIIQKTWKKMSSKAHERALQLDLSERNQSLIRRALNQVG